MTGAIFLDRDGVINRKPPEGDYVRRWADFEFLPGVIEALQRLAVRGRGPLIVVTNQRGVALGHMTRDDVDDIHDRMTSTLANAGVRLAGIEVCPHDRGTCDCRKPGIGLFLEAARRDPAIDVRQSAVVGDSISDLEAARRLGAEAFAVGGMSDALADLASERGIVVAGSAGSLLELVETGVLDGPIRGPAA
jgi:D-glycero-D-manno-heptose 1,7-bisphosphate phosphatase